MRQRFLRICLIRLAAIVVAVHCARADAQRNSARIQLAPRSEKASNDGTRWFAPPIETRRGQVATFDSKQLSLLLGGDAVPTRFAAERILDVRLDVVPQDQQAAIQMFRDGDVGDALPALIKSVSGQDPQNRPPVWRQQWLSMLAAQAAMRSGRGEIAFEIVEQLDARPLPPLVTALLPVDWTGDLRLSESMLEIAAQRAGSQSNAVKLVAASWLLGSPKHRDAAGRALVRLSQDSETPSMALLANQLTWRVRTPTEIQSDWRRWSEQIDELPMVLRIGPLIALTRRLKETGLAEDAKQLRLMLEVAAPAWHPDLASVVE